MTASKHPFPLRYGMVYTAVAEQAFRTGFVGLCFCTYRTPLFSDQRSWLFSSRCCLWTSGRFFLWEKEAALPGHTTPPPSPPSDTHTHPFPTTLPPGDSLLRVSVGIQTDGPSLILRDSTEAPLQHLRRQKYTRAWYARTHPFRQWYLAIFQICRVVLSSAIKCRMLLAYLITCPTCLCWCKKHIRVLMKLFWWTRRMLHCSGLLTTDDWYASMCILFCVSVCVITAQKLSCGYVKFFVRVLEKERLELFWSEWGSERLYDASPNQSLWFFNAKLKGKCSWAMKWERKQKKKTNKRKSVRKEQTDSEGRKHVQE